MASIAASTSLLPSIFGGSVSQDLSSSNTGKNPRKPRHKKGEKPVQDAVADAVDGSDEGAADVRSALFSAKRAKLLPKKPQRLPVVAKAKTESKKEPAQAADATPASTSNKRKRRRNKNKNSADNDAEAPKEEISENEENKSKAESPDVIDADNKDTAAEEHDGDDDDSEERTVFVGNLPLATTTRKSLAQLFQDLDGVAIESTRLRSVPVTGVKLPKDRAGDENLVKKVCAYNPKLIDYESTAGTVQGYVVFKEVDMVEKAIAHRNNTDVPDTNAPSGVRRLRVDRAAPTLDPSRSVFCGNLPYAADEVSLHDHFMSGCALDDVNDILGVRIVRDKTTHQCKGFGYVLFRERSLVPTALKRMHETIYMNKRIRVQVCGKRFKGQKAKEAMKQQQKEAKSAKLAAATSGSAPAAKATKSKADSDKKSAGDKAKTNGEQLTLGAFRRILAKEQRAEVSNKRKRGDTKKNPAKKRSGGLSKRAALERKTDQRVKKLQKRVARGMGKNRK